MSSEIHPGVKLQKLLDKVDARTKQQQRRGRIFAVVWVALLAVPIGTLGYLLQQMKGTEADFLAVVGEIEDQKTINKAASDTLAELATQTQASNEMIVLLRRELNDQQHALRRAIDSAKQSLTTAEQQVETAKETLADTQEKLDPAWEQVRLLKKDRQMLAYTLSEERNLYADMVLGELQDAEVAPERAREITRGILQRALLNEHVSPAEFGYVSARAEATGKTGGFESHRRRGALFLLTGEYAKAEEQFTSAIELPYARAREKAEAYVYRGCARARRGSYKDAIADLDLGLKYDRSGRLDAIISVFRGFALLRLEKYCEATAPLRHAIELGLSSPASHAYLGLAELAQGNIEVASDELDKAARLDPYFVETYDYQAKLFEAIGDKEKAKHARTRAEHIRAGARRIGRGTDPDRG